SAQTARTASQSKPAKHLDGKIGSRPPQPRGAKRDPEQDLEHDRRSRSFVIRPSASGAANAAAATITRLANETSVTGPLQSGSVPSPPPATRLAAGHRGLLLPPPARLPVLPLLAETASLALGATHHPKPSGSGKCQREDRVRVTNHPADTPHPPRSTSVSRGP